MKTQMPPAVVHMENSLLSSIIIDSSYMVDCDISDYHFYDQQNRELFSLLSKMHMQGTQIDFGTISEVVLKPDYSGRINITFLSQICDCPFSPNIEHYCEKIKEKHDLRQIIQISHKCISDAYDQASDAHEIIERSQKEIFEIGETTKKTVFLDDAVLTTFEELEELYKNDGSISGVPTGFKGIDRITSGLQKSTLTLVGGRPSMGKTAFAINIVKHAIKMGFPTLFFSIEMSTSQLVHRLLSDSGGIDLSSFNNNKAIKENWGRATDAASDLDNLPLYIHEEGGLTVEKMFSISRKMIRKNGIRLIVLDYIQLLKGWNKDGQGPKAEISRMLKMMSTNLKVPIIAISQLNRALESRSDKEPIMADLREAGSLEQDADMIMFVHRAEYYDLEPKPENHNKATILIRKNRQGMTGKFDIGFLKEYTRFYDLAFTNDGY